MNKFNKVMSASIIGLACAGAMGNAQAGAMATSVLTMSNFSLTETNGLAATVTSINANGTNASAQLNNSNGVMSAPPSGSTTYAVQACQGSCPDMSAFPLITTPTSTFAGASVAASGNPLLGGASVSGASYVSLTGEGFGNVSNTANVLNVGFTVTAQGDLTFAFDASLYRENYLSAGAQAGSQASTSASFNFNIQDQSGVPVFNWSPYGAATGGTSTATVDVPLTQNSHISAPGESFQYFYNSKTGAAETGTQGNATSGTFTADVNLAPGTYTLTGTMTTNASASFIPEPGALALMGIGLLGLVAVQRRQSRFN